MSELVHQSPPNAFAVTVPHSARIEPNPVPIPAPALPGYELLGELGRGGMGVVFRARDARLQRDVAVKMVLAGGFAGPAATKRFRAEAAAVARLQHPNIVQVYEVGESGGSGFDPRVPYFAMEFVGGGTLQACLADRPQSPRAAAQLVEILARAVHYAHQHGVLHRDLKPANVLLGPAESPMTEADRLYGTPKITDFGLAKRIDEEAGAVTATLTLMGTPSYMAPEQTFGPGERATALGPPADVYALGAILYEMLTGRPPFRGGSAAETLLQLQILDPAPPSQWQPGVPRDLESVALKCLEKDPARRYATAEDLAEDLKRFLNGEPTRARPVGLHEKVEKWARRNPTTAGLAAAVCMTAFAGFVAVFFQWREAEAARTVADRRAAAEAAARTQADADRARAESAREAAESSLYASHIARARLQWQAGNAHASSDALRSCEPSRRDWEWAYLYGRHVGQLCRFRTDSAVHRIAFSPDGNCLAVTAGIPSAIPSAGRPEMAPGRALIYDLATGQTECTAVGLPGSYRELTYSPNGNWLVIIDVNHRAGVYEAATGRPLYDFTAKWHHYPFAFSPDSTLLAALAPDGGVEIRDAATGDVRRRLEHVEGTLTSAVRFSPSGRLAVGRKRLNSPDQWFEVVEPKTGALLRLVNNVPDGPFCPMGRHVVAYDPGGYCDIWELPSGWSEPGPETVGRRLHRLRVNDVASTPGTFSPDGLAVATGGSDGAVRIWNVADGSVEAVFRGDGSPISSVAFNPDGTQIAAAYEYFNLVTVWDRTRHPDRGTFASPGCIIEGVGFTAGGARVASLVRHSGTLDEYEADSGALVHRSVLDFNSSWVSPSSRSAFGGKRIACVSRTRPNAVVVYDTTDTSKRPHYFLGSSHELSHVAVSANGQRVAATGPQASPILAGELFAWDASGAELLRVIDESVRFQSVALSADGCWLAAGVSWSKGDAKSFVQLYDLSNPLQPPRELRDKAPGRLCALAFSPDGTRLAAGGSGSVRTWEFSSASDEPTVRSPASELIYDLAFSPDGRRLAGAGRVHAFLWDTATGLEVVSFLGASKSAGDPGVNPKVAFSPDGMKLLLGNWDGTLSLFDAELPTAETRPALYAAQRRRATDWHVNRLKSLIESGPSSTADFHAQALEGRTIYGPCHNAPGEYHARLGRFADALSHFGHTAQSDDSGMAADRYVTLKLAVEGPEAFRTAASELLRHFDGRLSGIEAHRVSFACGLAAGASPDFLDRLSRIAFDTTNSYRGARIGRALALVRLSRAAEAIDLIQPALANVPGDGMDTVWILLANYVDALARAAIADPTAAAVRARAEAFHAANEPKGHLGSYWNQWLAGRLLRDELAR